MEQGPYETFADARTALLRNRHARVDALAIACAEAGVRLGRFDRRVIDQIDELDAELVWVLASIVRRAGSVSE